MNKKKWFPTIDILFESKLMTFLYVNHIILLLCLIAFAPFHGLKKAAFVIGIFVAVGWLHSTPITYMFISILFSIADGIILGQFVPEFLDNHYHLKLFRQNIIAIPVTIIFIVLFIFLYYRAIHSKNEFDFESSYGNDEIKMKNDKWFRENRYYWDKVDYYTSMGKNERQAKALAKSDIKEQKKVWKKEEKVMKQMSSEINISNKQSKN